MKGNIQICIFERRFNVPVIYLLFVLLALGTFIRFYNLTYTSLWLDEIYSMKAATITASILDVYENSKHDQPPLFFILLQTWFKIFGYSDYVGRALTCIFGILGILSIYFLGKEAKNQEVGLFAAFVTTVNWFHVGISIEMRFYALVFLLSTLSFLFFIKSLKNSNISNLAWYVVFTSFLLNTHYFGMVLFITQLLIFICYVIFFRKSFGFIIRAAIAGALAGLSIVHWLPVILHDLQISSFHIKPLTVRYLIKFFWWYFYDPASFVIYSIFFLLALRNVYKKVQLKIFAMEDLVISGWLLIGFLIPLIYSFLKIPLLTNKYCTIQVPAMFVFIGQGFASLMNDKIKTYGIIIITVSAGIILFVARPQYKKSFHEDGREIALIYFNSKDADKKSWNEDWREVAEFFRDQKAQKRVIFSQLSWFHEYYFKEYNINFPLDQNTCDFTNQVSGADSVYLLLHDHYKNGVSPIGFLPEQQKVIRENFELTDIIRFRKSKALLYVRKKGEAPILPS